MSITNIPMNIEAEQSVISAIFANNRVIENFMDYLRPEHFTHPAHQEIYKIALKQFSKGISFDVITTKTYLEQQGVLEDIGGVSYLTDLFGTGFSIINPEEYAKIVYDNAIRRELISISQKIKDNASIEDPDNNVSLQIENAEKQLYDLSLKGTTERNTIPMSSALKTALEDIEIAYKADGKLSGLTTGFDDLDKSISGLHASDLIIIAGRPAMGKTAFATNIAFNAANSILNGMANKKYKGAVVFFSLEMSASQLAARVLSSQSDINLSSIRNGSLTDEEFIKLTGYADALSKVPLFFDDTPGMSVPMIRTRARRIARKHGGLALIVIDYLQLMTGVGGRKNDNRVNEISEITRSLKMLAKELDVPVIALSQLSRNVEAKDRTDKKPQLSDLRESGSIEQDADIVMFTYREEYYLEHRDPLNKITSRSDVVLQKEHDEWVKRLNEVKGKAEIIIGKNRHGRPDVIKLRFKSENSLFINDNIPSSHTNSFISNEYNISEDTNETPDINSLPDDDI